MAMSIGEERTVRIAVEGDADIRAEGFGFRGDDGGMQRSAGLVDVAAVGRAVGEMSGSSEVREKIGGDGRSGAIGAVEDDAEAREVEAGNGGAEELFVVRAIFWVGRRRITGRRGVDALEAAEDFILNAEFGFVGQLVTVTAKDLDAVVLPGIVRGGNHHAGGESVTAREERDGRRRDHAGALDLCAAFAETCGKDGGDPWAGFASIHAKDDAGMLVRSVELMREGEADRVDRLCIERGFAGDRANAVRATQLSHGFVGSSSI